MNATELAAYRKHNQRGPDGKKVPVLLYRPIIKDVIRRDGRMRQLLMDTSLRGFATDWMFHAKAILDCPSGHGSDKGIYLLLNRTEVVLMENDPREQYNNLPTPENYYIEVHGKEALRLPLRSAKFENGVYTVLSGDPHPEPKLKQPETIFYAELHTEAQGTFVIGAYRSLVGAARAGRDYAQEFYGERLGRLDLKQSTGALLPREHRIPLPKIGDDDVIRISETTLED